MEGTEVGQYRLLRQIGAGGMGAVWLAEHTMLGRRAAIKVLHGEFTSRAEIVQRFFNEARAATAISDPGIVQVFDFGRHTDGSAYIVMELLDGQGLDRRIRDVGPMPPLDALRIIRQISKSLGAAHAVGIVHRDLKPENIYLVRDDEVPGGERAKILDFGIAKLQGDTAGWRTQTSQVMGTPLYMSPEQCRGAGSVDQRTDIYSLGCVLFVMLCGRPPFWAEGSGDLIAMHLREAPPTASSLNVRVTPEVDRLIAKCLAKDPAERFLNGIEMANAVTELVATLSTTPRVEPALPKPLPKKVDAEAVGTTATTLSSSTGAIAVAAQTAPPARSHGVRWVAAVFAAVVLVFVVGIVMKNRNPPAIADRSPQTAGSSDVPAPMPAAQAAGSQVARGSDTQPPASPVADRHAELTTRMLQVANGFLRWSATHAGAPCPTAKDVGVTSGDPWGHALWITCTDQPANQMIGILSDGPDGETGTRDDIASWTLPAEVTDAITGPKWTTKKTPHTPPHPSGTNTHGPKDLDGDGIPDTL